MRKLAIIAPLLLCGCAAQLQGKLGSIESALQNGGSITPITNLSSTLILQEWATLHNLLISMQIVNQSMGMVAITTPPPVVANMGGSTVVMPTTPVTTVPTSPVVMPTPTLPTGPTPNG